MDDYVDTTDDNGGVHINSGIPNHAFYLAATAIGGNAWEKRRTDLVRRPHRRLAPPDADFAAFAAATPGRRVPLRRRRRARGGTQELVRGGCDHRVIAG